MGGFSSFALSFSIISVLTGIVTTYDLAISNGGPLGLGLGWPLVSLGTLFVALAMAELASAFPTAGAMYHWAALFGGRGWGWFVAMMNLVGQVAIVSAIDLGCAQQIVATLGIDGTSKAWPWSGLHQGEGLVLPLFAVLVGSHAVLNLVSVRLVAWLNDLSAAVHVLGVVVLVALLLALGRVRPLGFVFETGFTTRPDGAYGLGFANALLLGMWTFTGFDASAHVSEETHDPSRRAPWGIVSSVVVSGVAGYALVIALTLGIRNLPAIAKDKHPALSILQGALGARTGDLAMGLAILAMWFCGLAAVTSTSRTLYAFARDGGLPGSRSLCKVSPRQRTPHVAILVATLSPLLLGLLGALLSEDQFLAVASLATTALYVSYGVPIALGALARHRGDWKTLGPWNLGKAGLPIAWIATLWSVAVLATFALPHGGAFLALLALVVAAVLALYLVFARKRFTGPRLGE